MPRKEKIDNFDMKASSLASMQMMSGLAVARHHAEKINYWIGVMPHVPKWETMAEEEIKKALTELEDVKTKLTEALALYHSKPIGE